MDYFGYGVLMVLTFYLFREYKYGWAAELVIMVYVNWELIGGLMFPVMLFGREIDIPQQGFAVLALIPIWLYNGKQGPVSKKINTPSMPSIQRICWCFGCCCSCK